MIRRDGGIVLLGVALLFVLCGQSLASPLEDAQRFFLIGDWDKTIAAYEQTAMDQLPVDAIGAYASACYRAGQFKKAEEALTVIQKHGENHEATVLSLLLAAREGRRSGAAEKLVAMLDKTTDKAGENARVLTALGEILRQINTGQALIYAKNAVERDPDNFWAWFVLGTIYEEAEIFDDAAKAYRQAIRLNPLSALAHNNLGYSYKERHFYRYAIDEYKKAIELMPDQPGFYYNIGNAYTHEEAIEEAFLAYKKAVELDPSFAKAHYNVARTYLRKDMVQKAIDSFRLYLEYGTKVVFSTVASQRAVEDEIEQLEQYLQGHPSMKYPKGQVAR
ncbi:MAG: hypothetical protein C0402_11240 [Thermodesulfovibrio sp.]|nr:hypothetical protein [Thermodesulfovibrio sp.]